MPRPDPNWNYLWKPSDVVVIIFLFLLIYAVAIWSGAKEIKDNRGRKHRKSPIDFFLGGRHMGWIIVGVSIAASNIGTDVLIALTGSVASAGLGGLSYEIGSGWFILCLGWFMGPMYLRSLLKTIPQFMEERYSPICRVIFVLFSVAIFILSKMGVNVYTGAIVFRTMTGDETTLWAFIPVIVVITAIYTFLGGLTSVMWADLIQLCIFMISGFASIGYCMQFFGYRLGNLQQRLDEYNLNRLQHLVLPSTDPNYPWPATTIGMLVHEYYYWSSDQEMAQRVLSSRGLGDARLGCALGSTIKVACFFLSVIPGWTARIFYEDCTRGLGHPLWCGDSKMPPVREYDMSSADDANIAYPLLVMREFPQGFKGLMITGFLAAVMSNLSGAINSLSTILTYDIYVRFFPPRNGKKYYSQLHLVVVGRVLVIICAGITIVWQVGIDNLTINLFGLTLAIQQHFGASIACTLLIGSTWKRSNKWGGFAGLTAGGIFAIIHVAMFLHEFNTCQEFQNEEGDYVEFNDPYYWFACLHQTITCCLIWAITIIFNVGLSLVTPKDDMSKKQQYFVHITDLIPRWVTYFLPRFKDPELDSGYIERIRREAIMAQREVDREVEENQMRQHGEIDVERQNKGIRKCLPFKSKKNKAASGNGEAQIQTADNMGDNADNGTNGNNAENLNPNTNGDVKEYNKTDDTDIFIDDDYLKKVKKDQQRKMFIADFAGVGAFFFTLFMYIWFR